MTTNDLGFRIVGPCTNERRLVDWQAAFVAYAALDERAEVNREGYLSAFRFGDDFRQHLDVNGSTKGFDGVCGARFVWFDIDRTDLEAARRDAARLCLCLVDRYSLDDDGLLIFFSGSKGFHVGLPTDLWQPSASLTFHHTARRLAEGLAAAAQVTIDGGVYDKVRAFRAPNSRHQKTGLHKRRLTFDELMGLSVDAVKRLAEKPEAFDVPTMPTLNEQAATDWREAVHSVERTTEAKAERRAAGMSSRLNRSTLDFIRNGAGSGDRHRLLFSAAANLAEFGCPSELVRELLTEAALDSGLAPNEVRRQIECGLKHHSKGNQP
ncbi:MAG: DNA primase [Planctomycetota bacterium]|nr:MAG: DNA primase [Planctomycetota bacterium]